MATILITGGSGLVGRRLVSLLMEAGHEIRLLSRSPAPNAYRWNPLKGELDEKALEGVDAIIHLAGENIGAKSWTNSRRKAIRDSRVLGLEIIREALERHGWALPTLVSASAVGYYGNSTSDRPCIESDPPATDFLGQVCSDWEASALAFKQINTRVVVLRTGLVLSRQGGVLPLLFNLGRLGLLTPLGSGRQAMPWIHLDDLCGLYRKALDDHHMEGAYNAVAPECHTNRSFSATLASTVKRPFFLPPLPTFLLKLFMGGRASLLLVGSRISPRKVSETGYTFQFPTLRQALEAEKKL